MSSSLILFLKIFLLAIRFKESSIKFQVYGRSIKGMLDSFWELVLWIWKSSRLRRGYKWSWISEFLRKFGNLITDWLCAMGCINKSFWYLIRSGNGKILLLKNKGSVCALYFALFMTRIHCFCFLYSSLTLIGRGEAESAPPVSLFLF